MIVMMDDHRSMALSLAGRGGGGATILRLKVAQVDHDQYLLEVHSDRGIALEMKLRQKRQCRAFVCRNYPPKSNSSKPRPASRGRARGFVKSPVQAQGDDGRRKLLLKVDAMFRRLGRGWHCRCPAVQLVGRTSQFEGFPRPHHLN